MNNPGLINNNNYRLKLRYGFLFVLFSILIYWWFFSLPQNLFYQPTSTAIYSQSGELLGATIASDGQWRFPMSDTLPDKFTKAVISFEDKRFYSHPGVDILALGRAVLQNIEERRIVSGASTISMQVIRLHRRDKPRVLKEKIIEMILAMRLECRYDKDEILALWAAHAPFGGNVVGLDAAAWRYYGRSPAQLSWSEAATLAVLPNAPTIIHPNRNRAVLRKKRDRLLEEMKAHGILDSMTMDLAKLEPLPDRPKAMPQQAPHLLMRIKHSEKGGLAVQTTLQAPLQKQINKIVDRHYSRLRQNQIHNAAVLVLDVRSNEIIAYCGNTKSGKNHGENVNIIHAPRSSGSILKPFLFAAMNQSGSRLPSELVADIPTQVAGYRPKNFHDRYDGAVPADEALSRSLNIPAVRALQAYGVETFHQQLNEMGFSTIKQSAQHYGLSLVLGGAEVTLWDLVGRYGAMTQVLNQYHERNGKYYSGDWDAPNYIRRKTNPTPEAVAPILDAGSIYLTWQALTSVKRPSNEFGWEHYIDSRKIAWKTGTSIGFRDAWAVGVTPEYVVGVWVGNADGEGRPDLVGVQAAAPILFDVFRDLPKTSWFERPHDELRSVEICSKSGLKSGRDCPAGASKDIHKHGSRSLPCTYHRKIQTDATDSYQVYSGCYDRKDMNTKTVFELPPAMAYYYRQRAEYEDPLPFHASCAQNDRTPALDVIYPQPLAEIKVPADIRGEPGQTIFEAAHGQANATVFWHVDGEFVGATTSSHTLALQPEAGTHLLRVVDDAGNEVRRRFEVLR